MIELLVYAMVVAAMKQKAYFNTHQVVVLTNLTHEKILDKLEKLASSAKWSCRTQRIAFKILKNHQRTDTFVEFVPSQEKGPILQHLIDGSSKTIGAGVGLVLITREKNNRICIKVPIQSKE